ncbi:MAG: Rho termination factor N-terminal domain-containing protein [Ferruginibacter sp.]
MYDISQLNDLLVPELLDIADHLTISNAKKLNKQDLITQILDKQSLMSTAKKRGRKSQSANASSNLLLTLLLLQMKQHQNLKLHH